MEKIGLIAGNRKFPIIFSEAAKKRGLSVVAIAIKGDTSPKLKNLVDKIYWLNLSEFSRMFDIFRAEGIQKVVMAGQISPWRLFGNDIKKDPQLSKILVEMKDKRADTIFTAIANVLKERGFELSDSTLFLDDFMPKKGVLTRREPDFDGWEDVYFGLNLAKEIAFLDIGQTVAVKNKAVVAVEALEGTDRLIRRCGKIAGAGITVVKVSKPNQDNRFDIPVVGVGTIKSLIRVKAACLAFEAGKTLFIDQEQAVRLADRKRIAVVAI